jgi:hypothetical protein
MQDRTDDADIGLLISVIGRDSSNTFNPILSIF